MFDKNVAIIPFNAARQSFERNAVPLYLPLLNPSIDPYLEGLHLDWVAAPTLGSARPASILANELAAIGQQAALDAYLQQQPEKDLDLDTRIFAFAHGVRTRYNVNDTWVRISDDEGNPLAHVTYALFNQKELLDWHLLANGFWGMGSEWDRIQDEINHHFAGWLKDCI